MLADIMQHEQKSGDTKKGEGECFIGGTQYFCETLLELQSSQRQAEVKFCHDTSVCNFHYSCRKVVFACEMRIWGVFFWNSEIMDYSCFLN